MKRTVLLFAGLLMIVTTASATEFNAKNEVNNLDKTKNYRYAQPIQFVERGVEFLIFPDGSFDFDINFTNTQYQSNSRRGSINASYNGPRVSINYSSSKHRNTYVSRDRNGSIRSIGDVYLNYDRYGKVTRVGSVYMDYGHGKNSTLTQVGGLRVNYNKWGEIASLRGFVNQDNRFVAYDIRRYNDNDYAYNNNRCDDDDNYYYYKQNGKDKKHKKNKR